MSDLTGLTALGRCLRHREATAELPAEHGASVAALDLDPSTVSGPLYGYTADLSDATSVRSALTAATDDLGGLDILVGLSERRLGAGAADPTPRQPHPFHFRLGHPAVASVLLGARAADEVRDAVEQDSGPVPPQVWRALREPGLLPDDVPFPDRSNP